MDFRDQLSGRDENLAAARLLDVVERDATKDTDEQGLADLVGLGLGQQHALVVAAVLLAHDDVLANVDETAREVTGVGGTEGGVGKSLAGSVRGDEELQHVVSVLERRRDRQLDDFSLRVGHESLHTDHLRHLAPASAGAGLDHRVRRVVLRERLLGVLRDAVLDLVPDLHDRLVALGSGEQSLAEVVVDLDDAGAALGHELRLLRDGRKVAHAPRVTGGGRVLEPGLLHLVQEPGRELRAVLLKGELHDVRQFLLSHRLVHEGDVVREQLVGDEAADRGHDQRAVLEAHADPVAHRDPSHLLGVVRVGLGRERLHRLLVGLPHRHGDGEDAPRDVLSRGCHRAAVGRLQEVLRGKHQVASLAFGLLGQRHVHGHLVSVEVGVVRLAHERMDLDRLALDEHRAERLDAEAVERRSAVEEDERVLGDLFQDVPHLRAVGLDEPVGRADVVDVLALDELGDDERAEQLERHLLRDAALVELEVRADHDDGASGVVDALSEQVLAEPSLLSLQLVGERLQLALLSGGGDDRLRGARAVVDERVHGLLEHALLVAGNDFRRVELLQAAQAVVSVDDAAVQVVQIGRGEAAAVEGDHRAQVRRNHRQGLEHHPPRLELVDVERLHQLQAAHQAVALGGRGVLHVLLDLGHGGLEIHAAEHLLHGLGADAGLEDVAVLERPVMERLLGDDLQRLELLQLLLHHVEVLLELGELLVADLLEVARLRLDLLLVVRELLAEAVHVALEFALDHLGLALVLLLHLLLRERLRLLIHVGDDEAGEVDDLLKRLHREVEHRSDLGRNAAEEPDVRHRGGELDVAHALAADDAVCDLHAALVADDSLEADLLVLAAVAFPVLGRPEDFLGEQPALLRLLGSVVDGFRLLNLAVAPAADGVRAGHAEADGVEVGDLQCVLLLKHIGRCWSKRTYLFRDLLFSGKFDFLSVPHELNVQTQTLEFADEHVE